MFQQLAERTLNDINNVGKKIDNDNWYTTERTFNDYTRENIPPYNNNNNNNNSSGAQRQRIHYKIHKNNVIS